MSLKRPSILISAATLLLQAALLLYDRRWLVHLRNQLARARARRLRLPTVVPSDERLLWATPRPDGFNNQLLSVYRAFRCAKRRNRTLVLPLMYENVRYDTRRAGPFPFADFFNVSKLHVYQRVATVAELRRRGVPCDTIRYRATATGSVHLLLQHYRRVVGMRLDASKQPLPSLTKLADGANSPACVDQSMCDGSEDTDLGPYSRYDDNGQGFDIRESAVFRALRAALVPHDAVTAIADGWIAAIGAEFNAVHVRRGDYERKCASMPRECDAYGKESMWQSGAYLRRRVSALQRARLPLFVSTTHDKAVARMLHGLDARLYFAGRLPIARRYAWARRRTDVLAMASQIVCSRAAQFVGNRFSSYTTEVNNWRFLRGHDETRLFF